MTEYETKALLLNQTHLSSHPEKNGWIVDPDTGLTLDTDAVVLQGVVYIITRYDYYWTWGEGDEDEMAGMCRYVPVSTDITQETFLQLWIDHQEPADIQLHRREFYLFARVHDVLTRFEPPRLDLPEDMPT